MQDLDIGFSEIENLKTTHALTASWVSVGIPIDTKVFNKINLYCTIVIGTSTNVRVRILALSARGGVAHVFPIKTVSATEVKLTDHYYEFDTDANQSMVIQPDIPVGAFIQVQVQDAAAGSGTITIDYNLELI